jgi:DUSP domain
MPPIAQGNLVKNAMLKRLELGARYYLIPTKWYITFDLWSRGLAVQPGKVDPASLLDGDGVLREDLGEGRDFHIIDQSAWDMIVQK